MRQRYQAGPGQQQQQQQEPRGGAAAGRGQPGTRSHAPVHGRGRVRSCSGRRRVALAVIATSGGRGADGADVKTARGSAVVYSRQWLPLFREAVYSKQLPRLF